MKHVRFPFIICAILLINLALTGCTTPCEDVPEGSLGDVTAWEQDFLKYKGLPRVPSRSKLTAEDGLELSYTDWVPESWDGNGPIALVVHGSSAHGALYAVIGQEHAAAGIYARLIDLRGHGHSRCTAPNICDPSQPPSYEDNAQTWPGRPGDSADEHQLARDLHLHLANLQTVNPSTRLFLAGHSSGAGLVARYIEHVGMSQLSGAILLAPFFHADQPQNELDSWACGSIVGTSYARVDLGAVGDARRGNPHRYVLSLDKPPALTDDLDTLRYTYTMMQAMAVTDPDLAITAMTGPTLWIAAENDALLDLNASRQEYQRIPGGKGFVVASDTSHVGVIWSIPVAKRMAEFIRAPNTPNPATHL